MSPASSLVWIAVVTGVIWVGIFLFCLSLDRRIRRLEEGS